MVDREFVFGRNPVLDMLSDGQAFEQILLQKGVDAEFAQAVRSLAKSMDIPVLTVPKEKLNRVTRKNHQGVIGFVSWVQYTDLGNTVQNCYEAGRVPLVLILDHITDVRNVGAVARSAEIFGVDALVLPLKGSARIGAMAVKTSAGAITRLSLCRVKSLAGSAHMLADMGLNVCAAVQTAEVALPNVDLTGPTAIILGSEDKGIGSGLLKAATHTFTIPQIGQTESLNVSVAGGITLYEAIRQRKTS